MLHEALMLEIYRQALNAGALPTARPRSTESANSSERCPSHESNSSENGKEHRENSINHPPAGILPLPNSPSAAFPSIPNLPGQPPSMEAYLHMVAAAAQQYGFPLGAAAAAAAAGPRLPLPLPTEAAASFKLPPQASPTASSNHSEALDFRTNMFARSGSAEPAGSDEEEEEEEANDANNPLDLSVGTRKRSADDESEPDSSIGQIQVKKIFKSDSPPLVAQPPAATQVPPNPLMPGVNPYLAAVAAANIFRSGQFPDWNGKSDLVVDPLEKMSDIVKGPRKEKSSRNAMNQQHNNATAATQPINPQPPAPVANNPLPASNEGITKTRHNIWQSHWQNKGVASSVFRCVWCKQSFATLEALTTHMKDSKHCGVNVPPFGNLPTANERPAVQQNPAPAGPQHHRQQSNKSNNSGPSQAAKNAFQYRGDPPTPLPRKLVRGQNVWLGKGVEQAMQILKCMRCGESFRSLNEMTKHMQETQHYTNILSQEQTISMKSSSNAGENKEGQNSLSSEESRTLSAVLTCKVCDKAFNSLGDLSNHMAKNNHYAEPLMQSMGTAGNRKRPAPKKREKSLPVRKLLEMKGAQDQVDTEMDLKMQQRPGMGPGSDKTEAALFAERMRQYITGIKSDEAAKNNMNALAQLSKTKSPELMESPKNGATKTAQGSSSVLSAIEQMFTTSFDTPTRHAALPATSPSNSSTKNTSPVASSILKRLGIDENVDYNKPLIDTNDPYYQHYRYTSSERSASECSAETHNDSRKMENPTPDKPEMEENPHKMDYDVEVKKEPEMEKTHSPIMQQQQQQQQREEQMTNIKMEIKAELEDEQEENEGNSPRAGSGERDVTTNGNDYSNNNNNNTKECNVQSPKAHSPQPRVMPPRSPTDSHRSMTPKSPASSIKSYDGGEKKYPSDSLNALSSMFDSLGSTTNSSTISNRPQPQNTAVLSNKIDSPENLTTSNSLAALRQFCIKKEKTA
ncbi:protein teashirt [Lucilia cuprina]|uniref:protein teashirt n=1 Tax=Lucilia cuprina TaxID=7375 RepID=UPI001F0675F3|nr:protein teashirt [Lucilia cuprina]